MQEKNYYMQDSTFFAKCITSCKVCPELAVGYITIYRLRIYLKYLGLFERGHC